MEADLMSMVTQLGAAGLIGWMWLSERRAASERERQLREAHQQIVDDRGRSDSLIAVVEANTRAMTAVEVGQRRLLEAIADGARRGDAPGH